MKFRITILVLLFLSIAKAQTVPNFNVTDSNGKVHKLYEDYLDKGKVVVLKIFFVDCPPCNAIAPATQQKYIDWGAGNSNVQFIEMTNKIGDISDRVNVYKTKHGITFPSIGSDGGALDAILPYTNGTFGPWYGTPFFAVIAPNKKVNFDALFNNLNALISAAGGTMLAPSNKVTINTTGSSLPSSGISYFLKSASNSAVSYNITQLTNGSNVFDYPSTLFPVVANPIITLESTAPAFDPALTVLDLIAIRSHILGTIPFTSEVQKIAADVNGNGKISASDLVILQKAIAGFITNFPNNVPSYKLFPSQIPFTAPAQGGAQITVSGEVIKMGNVK